MRWILAALPAIALAVVPIPVHSRDTPPELEPPLDCALPERCFVQFYVDHASGPAVSDFRCGLVSYDGHAGTDFRVRSPDHFRKGIPVVAAAAGTVLQVRDGMDDVDVLELGRPKVAGMAGGNHVVIRHPGGWQTRYWHLRKGSVAVHVGDEVAAGARLGVIGLSGDTNFPHLHFELRDPAGGAVDPFAGRIAGSPCENPAAPAWTARALEQMRYAMVAANTGFAARALGRAEAIYGATQDVDRSGELHFWFELFGVARGDRIAVQFILPDGTQRRPVSLVWSDNRPYLFRAAQLGVASPLQPGTYAVQLSVQRNAGGGLIFDQTYSREVP